jgi:hypothetical protein
MIECSNCKVSAEPSDQFCIKRGHPFSELGASPIAESSKFPTAQNQRPNGVRNLALLEGLNCLVLLVDLPSLLALLAAVLSLLAALGIISRKGWALNLVLIASALAIITSVITLLSNPLFSLIGIALNILIISYLPKRYIRAYFGKR